MSRKIVILTIVIGILISVNAYVFFSSSVFSRYLSQAPGPVFNTTQAYVLPVSEANYLPILNAGSGEPQLSAKSAAAFDLKSGRFLYNENSRQKLPIASLTKVMSAIVTWENLDPNAIVTVGKESTRVDGERRTLYAGEHITVRNLLQLMLVESSNDAAYALAAYAKEKNIDFVALMNQKAADLQMLNTHFLDPAGLNDSAYSTTEDLVKAVVYALRYDAIWNFSKEKTATVASTDGKITHDIKSTNQLLGILNNIVGGKTGYTDTALGCMILVVDIPNQSDKIISIVLGSRDRFQDTKTLVDWVTQSYRWQ